MFSKEYIDTLAEKVHESWEKEKRSRGYHSPKECRVGEFSDKFVKRCSACNTNLYPFEELPFSVQEYDRVTVMTVLSAVKDTKESLL